MRARAAYLTGAGIPFQPPDTSQDFTHASPETPYGRFDPVAAPVLVMQAVRTEGESVEHLVIRSIDETTPPGTVLPDERWVAPPKTSALQAEQHGMFDVAGTGMDKTAYEMIASAVRSNAACAAIANQMRPVMATMVPRVRPTMIACSTPANPCSV